MFLSRVTWNKFLLPSGLPRPLVITLRAYTKDQLVRLVADGLRRDDLLKEEEDARSDGTNNKKGALTSLRRLALKSEVEASKEAPLDQPRSRRGFTTLALHNHRAG